MRRKTNKRKNTLKRYIGGKPTKDGQPTVEELAKHRHKTQITYYPPVAVTETMKEIRDILRSTTPENFNEIYYNIYGDINTESMDEGIKDIMATVRVMRLDLDQARVLAEEYLPVGIDRPVNGKYAPAVELMHRYISYRVFEVTNNWDHEGGQKPAWAQG